MSTAATEATTNARKPADAIETGGKCPTSFRKPADARRTQPAARLGLEIWDDACNAHGIILAMSRDLCVLRLTDSEADPGEPDYDAVPWYRVWADKGERVNVAPPDHLHIVADPPAGAAVAYITPGDRVQIAVVPGGTGPQDAEIVEVGRTGAFVRLDDGQTIGVPWADVMLDMAMLIRG